MMRKNMLIVLSVLLSGVLLLFALGSARYGGPSGLLLRVRAEFASQQSRPAFVPTPLPTVPARATQPGLAALPVASATLGPTLVVENTVSATPLAAAEVGFAESPTATPPPSTPLAAALSTPGPRVELSGLTHVWQTWNNCGPATLSMCLSFWGSVVGQEEIRLVVRPNPEDKHAGPEELAEVARAQGLNALVRVDGTPEMLRQLLSGGVPVMVSTWHEDDPGDGMGHYRLIVGYDDGIESWLLYDSLAATASDRNAPYEPLRLSYDEFAPLWEVFNRRYLVVYSDDLESVVRAVVGEDMDDRTMWEGALARARSEIAENDVNPFAWFNLGTDLVALSRFEEAASAYDHARQLGLPWRMLWYQFWPFPAYYQVGRYEEVLALANATLAVTKDIEELHFWRGMALAALGDAAEARASLERALDLKPGYPEALAALEGLG
ncbi:MAG: tetratricopeptide repeat protein [Anaerolineae bacterium]